MGFGAILGRALRQSVSQKMGKSATTIPDREIRKVVTADPATHADFVHLMNDSVSDVLHPGYIHTLGFPLTMELLTEPDFPLPLLGMVHISNTVTVTRPIRIDEEMEIVATIDGARPHYAGTLIDSMLRVFVGGVEVMTDHSEYLVRGSDFGGERPPRPEREEFVPPMPTGTWVLGADAGRTYAAVSGDSNPIHLTKLSAKAFGFDRPIVHGMYSASRAFSACPRKDAYEWYVSFEAPIKLPGKVAFAVTAGDGYEYAGWRQARGDKPARRHFVGHVK